MKGVEVETKSTRRNGEENWFDHFNDDGMYYADKRKLD